MNESLNIIKENIEKNGDYTFKTCAFKEKIKFKQTFMSAFVLGPWYLQQVTQNAPYIGINIKNKDEPKKIINKEVISYCQQLLMIPEKDSQEAFTWVMSYENQNLEQKIKDS